MKDSLKIMSSLDEKVAFSGSNILKNGRTWFSLAINLVHISWNNAYNLFPQDIATVATHKKSDF